MVFLHVLHLDSTTYNNLKYRENLFIVQYVPKLNTQISKKAVFFSTLLPLPKKSFLVFLELCIFIHFHSTHKTEVQSPITGLCLRRECRILDNLPLLKAYSESILKILLDFLSFYFQLTLFNSICSLDLFLLIVFPVQL